MLSELPAEMTQKVAREEIAKRYGFPSFAALLDVSERLPPTKDDSVPCYLAYSDETKWFLWRDDTYPDNAGETGR
jgi:hypothetical protein